MKKEGIARSAGDGGQSLLRTRHLRGKSGYLYEQEPMTGRGVMQGSGKRGQAVHATAKKSNCIRTRTE